jgi:predicted nucleotidyltransferase
MSNKKVILNLFVLLCCSFMIGNVLGESLEVIQERGKMMLAEAEGKLVWIKMTNFPNNPWKELVLLDEEENIVAILIGEKVEEILDKEGEIIKVKGLLKPEMRVKGEKVPVIEVREIELLIK